MPQPIQCVPILTRRVLVEELDEITLMVESNPYAARLRVLELRLAVETKPFDIDPQ